MSKKTLSHVVWECKYHVVLVPKYRYQVFGKEVREAARDELKKLCLYMRVDILEGHVSRNHVHMCLSILPNYEVSEVMGTLKSKTAIRMFNRFPELRKRY